MVREKPPNNDAAVYAHTVVFDHYMRGRIKNIVLSVVPVLKQSL